MRYVWDEAKNRTNISKHGISFEDAPGMFEYPMLACMDTRQYYGEERWVGIGFLGGIIAVIVYSEDDERDETRIISVRKATKNESNRFKETLGY
jgi:hypothetical protein